MKRIAVFFLMLVTLAMLAVPASAQLGSTWNGGLPPTNCYKATWGMDLLTGRQYACGDGTGFKADVTVLGTYQGTTATAITDTNFTVLTGPAIKVSKGMANLANKHIIVRGKGVYTNAAASLLNVDLAMCTISGCGSGTVLSPAGCVVTSTNQANNLTNGQFTFECELIVASTGSSGTVMAKASAGFNLGATTAAVTSTFQDTATAVSAAVDLTVDEFLHPRFKFSSSNAGNSATLHSLTIALSN